MNIFTPWTKNNKAESANGHETPQFASAITQSNSTNSRPTGKELMGPSYSRVQDLSAHAIASQAQINPSTGSMDVKVDPELPKAHSHRIVSTTKRAEQNRNAQRAFRIRKANQFKELESKAKEVDQLKSKIESLEARNRSMANYICELQRQIIEFNNNKTPSKSDDNGKENNTPSGN
ncbi:AP-1-like transcription factor, putative [Candida dubliniensis CD36]|uniref:AP-1-like transcription factor, putative n=1 Tax=Candida dubliniensis (strain CD36 / ATCC MYA-646 / CBS 7987 / NCPF 3949 / NRRL Y-17841) TaxID=573826 RepID=B9WB39_CANDC|nr:AP-1-like transcription factor, putative [Candida dubliniensis CD36]CAX43609.1 AP-1-like transcription factor, putative [Candida dubliniensis CD36]